MATPNVLLGAAICLIAGASTAPRVEQVRNYVFAHTSADAPHFSPVDEPDKQPQDYNGVGAALVAGGITSAYWLERVFNIVLTYPYYRAGQSGEIMQTTTLGPWG